MNAPHPVPRHDPGIGREHFREILKPTPFFARLDALNVRRDWAGWPGWMAANSYYDPMVEYFTLRAQATLYDLSPMTKYRVEGPDAEAFLNRLVTRNVAKQRPGRVAYCLWCDEHGHVLDDGTLFRFSATRFRLCCQERHLPWLQDTARGFDVVVEEETEAVAGLALQGPCSAAILRRLGLAVVEALKPFDLAETSFDGKPLAISRTGFTGDLGYELWVSPEHALALWDRLWEAGQDFRLSAMGSTALNLARLEAGFIMARTDFVPAEHALRATRGRSPFELGQEKQVDFAKGPFNGRRALLAQQEAGPTYCLVPLELEGHKTATGSLVYYKGKQEVGFLTTAAWSPTCKRNLAFASLRRPFGAERTEDLWVEVYVLKELKWDKVMARARVVERPFFQPPRRRLTPPADY